MEAIAVSVYDRTLNMNYQTLQKRIQTNASGLAVYSLN